MLQQTQVATVISYFENWLQRFPDVVRLANASEDEVMELWAGLGYYARARNILKAARLCEGTLPDDYESLVGLPGIGPSTANAIVSQVTDTPAAVLDGNVRRVLARHAAIEGWTGKSDVQKRFVAGSRTAPAESAWSRLHAGHHGPRGTDLRAPQA